MRKTGKYFFSTMKEIISVATCPEEDRKGGLRGVKKIMGICVGLILFLLPAFAANQITMTIDKNHITTDEAVQITMQIEGNLQQGQRINVPGLENFTIAKQSRSQNMQIINGEATSNQTIMLSLSPNNAGTFTIGPVAMTDDEGNIITSDQMTITVEKSLVDETKEKLINSLTPPQENENDVPSKDTEKKPFPEIQKKLPISLYFWLEVFGVIIGVVAVGILIKMLKTTQKR